MVAQDQNNRPHQSPAETGGWFDWLKSSEQIKDEASDLGAEVISTGLEQTRRNRPRVEEPGSPDRQEVLGESERQRHQVKSHVIDRFLVDADVGSERAILGRGITQVADRGTVISAEVASVIEDEDELRGSIDQLEGLEDRIRRDRAEEGLATDEDSIRQALEREIGRFASPEGGREEGLQKRSLNSRAEVIQDNWKRYIERGGGIRNLWSLISGSTVDMVFKYGSVAQVLPVWNAGIELNRNAQDIRDQADPYLEATRDGAQTARKGLRGKREAEIEGTAVMLKVKDWASSFSQNMKSVVFDVARGRQTPDQVYQRALGQLEEFKRTSPEAFDQYLRSRRANFLDLQKRETVAGLIFRTCDWYLKPQYRTSDTLREDLAEALPIYGTYAAIRDLNDENGLPTWMRYGFVGFNVGLDALTIASLGAFTPVATAARMAIGFGAKTGARMATKAGATFSAKNLAAQAGARAAQFSSKEFLASLPRATRRALLSTTTAKMLTGYAAYSGLSHTVDYVFGQYLSEEIIEEVAEASVEKVLEREFTEQQRRLIRITSRTAIEVAQNAANDNNPEAGVLAQDDDRRSNQSDRLAA